MDNTFLREAIEKIEELTDSAREPHVVKIAGKTYCDKSMSRYDKEEFAEPLTATSLNSLIDYISGKSEELRESMIIHVESPTRVRLLSGLTQERNREELLRADTNPNGFDFDHYYDQEAFVINMQTAFKQSDETELILSVAGNVENKTVANYGDDGVSQKATITKGIAGKEDSPDCRYHFSSWRKRQPGETGTDCRTVFFRKDQFFSQIIYSAFCSWSEAASHCCG